MESKRAVSPLGLAVLTHLFEKSRHPYELAATLKERGKEKSVRLNYGSLYAVISSLERDGYVRAAGTGRDGKRPEKTVYKITPQGEVFMLAWMRDLLGLPVKEFPQFEAALSLMPVLSPEEVVDLLAARIRRLQETLTGCAQARRQLRDLKLPRLFSIEGEYFEAMTRAECRFCERLLRDLRRDAGGLTRIWKNARHAILVERQSIHSVIKKTPERKEIK